MRSRMPRGSVGTFLAPLLLIAACQPDAVTSPVKEATDGPEGTYASYDCTTIYEHSAEPEVFGNILSNGERICSSMIIRLFPQGETQTWAGGMDESQASDPTFRPMWGWYDPNATDGPCVDGSTEIHAPGSTDPELHCVLPGQYSFRVGGSLGEQSVQRAFPVDYTAGVGTVALPGGGSAYVEVPGYNGSETMYHDLVIDSDFRTDGGFTDMAVLEIDTARGSVLAPATFSPKLQPTGDAYTWFRFGVHKSTRTGDGGRGSMLARLYYDCTATQCADASGYFDFIADGAFLRVKRFPNPIAATRNVVVALEILRDDENALSSSRTGPFTIPSGAATRTITLRRINPDLTVSSVSAPASTAPGATITTTIVEHNASDSAAAESGWTGQVWLSTDGSIDPSDLLLTSYSGGTLGIQESRSRELPVTIPAGTAAGGYYMLARLDATSAMLERSEANNVGTTAIQLTAGQCAWYTGKVYVTLSVSDTVTGAGPCGGRTAVLTNGTGRAGFVPNGCGTALKTNLPSASTFTLIGCQLGTATLRIYRDAAATQLEATATVRITSQPVE